MTWNYRVMRYVDLDGEPFLAIHEVYYDKEGKPNGYTENAVSVGSETIEGMHWVLDRMREALDKPILRESDFEK